MTMAMAMAGWVLAAAIMAAAIMTPITARAMSAAAMAGTMIFIIRARDIMSMIAAAGVIAGRPASGATGKRGETIGATAGGGTAIVTDGPAGVAMDGPAGAAMDGPIVMDAPAIGNGRIAMDGPIVMGVRAIGNGRTVTDVPAIMVARVPMAMTVAGTGVVDGMAGAGAMARPRSVRRPGPRQVSPGPNAA